MSRRMNNQLYNVIYIYMSIGMNKAPCIALSMSSICFEVVFCANARSSVMSLKIREETEHGHRS